MNLAQISFALRFYNQTEEEDAEMLPKIAPWSYSNIPVPKSVTTIKAVKYGRRGATEQYLETLETFEDGSSCIVPDNISNAIN